MLKPDFTQNHPSATGSYLWVEIRLKENLEPHWHGWFGDLAITPLQPGQTQLSGAVSDHSALHGILERIRDLNLQLVSVQVLELPREKDPATVS